MTSSDVLNPESEDFNQARPNFFIGQHDSFRSQALTDDEYSTVLNTGVSFTAHIRLHRRHTYMISSTTL
jgi:protein arginine N-methyltransferase 5